MTATITLMGARADDLDAFEALDLDQRRRRSGGWVMFPVGSGRALESFLMRATQLDLGVFKSGIVLVDDEGLNVVTFVITSPGIARVIEELEELIANAGDTARALVDFGGGRPDPTRVKTALRSGVWPSTGDPAEEAAAFAHQLLLRARVAIGDRHGMCWEYRGSIAP